ncbi:uncharacterized protein GGS22DRAFT_195754 [Annulohypoxylon maeteangense]|uniref:uncharacterized protein n=1 Tax=Annulohypoxylon maeteangense TaxID=1927788 RepID=UPI00200727D2|nr:uncharacterized protein GGS22DRAFT_195754 [Annulohypoxylon maeteangense]KAI0882479.1 hypothetical protein GGS22DRAFT_195754 [Annulohypoxylon maeteangense]
MSIFEDARKGILTRARLNSWLKPNSTIINMREDSSGWTLLVTAGVSGFQKQVDQLLLKGADVDLPCKDGETPLLATWKTKNERPLIVQTLLRHKPRSIDKTCGLAMNNTPLMYAIEKADIETVRLLRRVGASLEIKNNDGFNAKEVAQNTGNKAILRALDPSKEQFDLMRVASDVVTFILYIIFTVGYLLDGIVVRVFGLSGEENPRIDSRVNPGPEELTPEDFVRNVDVYVKDNPVLNTFFKDKKNFIQDLAQNLWTLQRTRQVIYCDDSGSMTNNKGKEENRWGNQKELVLRIARTTTRILPDGEGVALRFINNETDNSTSLDLEGIGTSISSIVPKGNTNIGTTLEERILEPLVYSRLEAKALERPLLITIITDGGPEPESKDMLAKVIVECGDRLVQDGFPRDSVKFLIGQIGSSNRAVDFLNTLKNNDDITKVAHIFAGRLDDEFKKFRDERGLERWLIETLFMPLAAAETKKNK